MTETATDEPNEPHQIDAAGAGWIAFLAIFGGMSMGGLLVFLMIVGGFDATMAAITVSVSTFIMMLMAPIGGRLVERFGGETA